MSLKLKTMFSCAVKGSLIIQLYVEFAFWLGIKQNTPVSLCLIGVRLNGFTAVIQCYVQVPVNFRDLMDSLFDTFGAPISPNRSGGGIIHSLVKTFPLCKCDLVLVPWADNAQPSTKLFNVAML